MLCDWPFAVAGGELLTRLDAEGQLSDGVARFYTACVVSALASLHEKGYVYRVRASAVTCAASS